MLNKLSRAVLLEGSPKYATGGARWSTRLYLLEVLMAQYVLLHIIRIIACFSDFSKIHAETLFYDTESGSPGKKFRLYGGISVTYWSRQTRIE
jgi:hypothetical protein